MKALRPLALAALVFLALVVATDQLLAAAFPLQARLGSQFSTAYVRLCFARLRRQQAPTVVLGDSVLWGYRLQAAQSAVAQLHPPHGPIANFAFEGGSPINTYAMLLALMHGGVRPRLLIFNVNQKSFNPADSAYATIHPAVEPLVPELRPMSVPRRSLEERLRDAVTAHWQLYAMRADLRQALFGEADAARAAAAVVQRLTGASGRRAAAHAARAEAFEGSYDLTPLDESNASVRYLARIIALVRREHLAAVAVLTPTNHELLHAYVDSPEYAANLRYVARLLERGGVRVVDLDRAFRARDFFDNDHLTQAGNVRLAALLQRSIEAQ